MSALSPERWREVKAVFHGALELDAGERPGFLAKACAADPELHGLVESLLLHHGQAGGFISTPPGEALLGPLEPVAGQRIGPYRVLGVLGRGGMGSVYLAERADQQFQKRVAIKCIQRGMESNFIQERFRRERQILADLDHPNIARLLDGGTTDEGVPYLVMELVEGVPVDAYCEARGLDLRERLGLFRSICAAVQYAHQNLVVHRDIKPGNILVTGEGVPKLLDFGIAKLVDADLPEATATGTALMTPEFCSPEQVRREPITTVSDVYSLGVLLYLLLAGKRPYQFTTGAPGEVLDLVCLQEPERPSAAARSKALEGDLDNIVLMAMRKEPARRYGSAEQLSEDVRRHLAGLPVLARQDTLGYRIAKLVQRNRAAAAGAVIAVAALLGGSALALQQARAARRERAKAELRFNEVRKLTESFLFEFHDALRDVPGTFEARRLVVARAREYLDRLASEAGNDPGLQSELAVAYTRLASVARDSGSVVEDLRKALAITKALADADPANAGYRHDLANNHSELAGQLRMVGDTAGALRHAREAAGIMEALMASAPRSDAWTFDLVSMRCEEGNILAEAGDLPAALDTQRKALADASELASRHPGNLDYRQARIVSLACLGDGLEQEGEFPSALEGYQEALRVVEETRRLFPGNAVFARDTCILHRRIGRNLVHQGKPAAAREHLAAALRGIEALIAADPADVGHQRVLAAVRLDEGHALAALGRTSEAFARFRWSLAISEAVAARDSVRAETRADMAEALLHIGSLEGKLGHTASGAAALQRACGLLRELHRSNPPNAMVARSLADANLRSGDIQLRRAQELPASRREEARLAAAEAYRESLNITQSLKARNALLKSDEGRITRAERGLENIHATLDHAVAPALLLSPPQ